MLHKCLEEAVHHLLGTIEWHIHLEYVTWIPFPKVFRDFNIQFLAILESS
jgi:hypothetical protein